MSASTALPASASMFTPHPRPDLGQSSHYVQFYEDDSFLLDSLAKLIGTALVAGDTCIVVATPAHRDGITERLKARGLDLEVGAKLGTYCALDAAETLAGFMVNGTLDDTLFTSFVGYMLSSVRSKTKRVAPRLIIFGEMVALLVADGKADVAIKLERLWNDLARTHSFDLYCAYPMKSFDQQAHSQAFLDICAEHPHVVPTENFTALANEDDRLRHISLLEQRAKTAENEAAGRLRAEGPCAVPKSSPLPDASPPASHMKSIIRSRPSPTRSTLPGVPTLWRFPIT